MRIRSVFFSALVLLVSPAALKHCAAQQTAPAPPAAAESSATTLKVQAHEVILPVTVRNKHGELVTDLTASDFALTDNGKPQTIKGFSRESNLPFQVGLLVDTSRSMARAMETERKAAEKFVDLMLPDAPPSTKGGDQAFLIHFDREVELLEDFTSSRAKLDNDLEQMGPTQAEHNDTQGPETNDSEGGGYGQRGGGMRRGGGTQLYDAIYLAANDMMKPKNGRKALVVFSDGQDRGSKESLDEAIDAAERANTSVYTIYFKGDQERGMGGGGFPGGRHGGMGGGWPGGGGRYPGGGGYPGGGRRGGGGSQAPQVDGKKIMAEIATRTGGRPFEAKKVDDLAGIYNQIAQELRGQYLLTYSPDPFEADGSFHKVALTTKKGDLTVTTREGYYAPDGQ
ncbi:MAG TPA: VWA domain-containing protein [Terracidiphilus sp.]|nr:VWA domain-containing protein [Terracidiphilus sp.]